MTAAKFRQALAAAVGVAASVSVDGISNADIWAILIAALGALGVYITPNKDKPQ